MKPVYQTIFGNGKNGQPSGNCFAASIASILELPVEEVPNFCAHEDFIQRLNSWLAPRGFFYLEVQVAAGLKPEEIFMWAGSHIISGDGPRGLRHSVVGFAGVIAHDPHPSGAGLLTQEEFGF